MSTGAVTGTAGSSTGYQGQPGTTTAAKSTEVTKNMFMQLLVAQLRNQDPLKPSDSTAFVGQLAQFQQMEQSVNSGQDITAIRTALDQLVAARAAAAKTSNS